jgi:hypothetical protein
MADPTTFSKPRCRADPSLERLVIDGFQFPLGVYPVEPMQPKAGYAMLFEPADGDDQDGDWEEWPDRYLFDAVISAERIEPLCRNLFSLFKGRVYPIFDVLGHDDYREVDPYISYDLIGIDRLMDVVRRFRDYFYEDGMCGFGAMTEEPFFYVFVDEHKIITVRAEPSLKEKLEKILHAFDLEQMEEPAGADSASHEHRAVLLAPPDRPDQLSGEEIVERLRDEWRLLLNVNSRTNVDEEGNELGVTSWRCVVRCWEEEGGSPAYAEIVLAAGTIEVAEETAMLAAEALEPPDQREWSDMALVSADRLRPEHAAEVVGAPIPQDNMENGRIILSRWLE